MFAETRISWSKNPSSRNLSAWTAQFVAKFAHSVGGYRTHRHGWRYWPDVLERLQECEVSCRALRAWRRCESRWGLLLASFHGKGGVRCGELAGEEYGSTSRQGRPHPSCSWIQGQSAMLIKSHNHESDSILVVLEGMRRKVIGKLLSVIDPFCLSTYWV